MIRHLAFALALPALLATCLVAAETYEEMQQQTDMTNAESVYRLAEWCSENRMPTRSQQLYRQVLKIDKDHQGANAAVGNVLVGDRWVNKAFAPKQNQPSTETGGDSGTPRRSSAGPGPTAKNVAWNLTLDKDPGPADNPFIDRYVQQLRKSGNDSNEMGAAVATLLREDNWPSSFPRLCKALLEPGFGDVYGPSEMLLQLMKQDRNAEVRRLYPFVVKASEGVTDPDDLEYFAMVSIGVRERKAVPRLGELLANPSTAVQDSAREALSAITRLPARDLTPEKVKAWWDANWSMSEDQVLAEQLGSNDPLVAVEAAAGLCEMRNKDIFPVLFKLLRSDDPQVLRKAVDVLRRATALDWGISVSLPADQRDKRVEMLERWWKESKFTFNWPGLPSEASEGPASAQSGPSDPDREAVERLASTAGTESQDAELRLRGRGRDGVPALLGGLESPNPLIRRRSHDILREITKQDFAYDPRDDEGKRMAAIEAWRKWATEEKLLPADK